MTKFFAHFRALKSIFEYDIRYFDWSHWIISWTRQKVEVKTQPPAPSDYLLSLHILNYRLVPILQKWSDPQSSGTLSKIFDQNKIQNSTVPEAELHSCYSKRERYTKLRRQVKQDRIYHQQKWPMHWGCTFTIMHLVVLKSLFIVAAG